MGNGIPVFTVTFFKNIFMRVMPQSLRARLIALVLLAVLAGQAATLYAVSLFQRDYVQTVAIDLVATTIRTLQFSMELVRPKDRAAYVQHASQGEWKLWSKPLPNDARLQRRRAIKPQDQARMKAAQERQHKRLQEAVGLPPSYKPQMRPDTSDPTPPAVSPSAMPEALLLSDPRSGTGSNSANKNAEAETSDNIRRSLSHFIQRLNDQLDGDSRVAISRGPTPELYISLTRPDDSEYPQAREWLVIPLDQIDPPLTTPMMALWAGGLALVLLIALWFSWHISRPITSLVQATDQLAAGKPARVEPAGPSETRLLGERFNAMLDALSHSESTRRTLLAGLPHDLKAPLARMWLRIEMTDDLTLKQGLRTDLKDMQQMVDQFINFLRGTDPASYQFAPFALNEWLQERVGNWQGTGEQVSLDCGAEYVEINADSVALSRLLDNLISNALHHGKPPVMVQLRREGPWALLTVSDHGAGIAPEHRDDALRPFVRLDAARTRTGNVGLGLALCEVIAQAHGGALRLGQGPGGGLEVEVRLPIHHPA